MRHAINPYEPVDAYAQRHGYPDAKALGIALKLAFVRNGVEQQTWAKDHYLRPEYVSKFVCGRYKYAIDSYIRVHAAAIKSKLLSFRD